MTRNQWYAHAGAADAFFSAPFSPFVGAISVVATFLKSFDPMPMFRSYLHRLLLVISNGFTRPLGIGESLV